MPTKDYSKYINRNKTKPNYFINSFRAFIVGGSLGIIGQGLSDLYFIYFELSRDNANSLMLVTLILAASLLTGFGVLDTFGQFAGAGLFVPITGFANSMTSAALEARSEGLVLGVAANMFKLAGAVITFGIVSAYIFGIIRVVFVGG
ncbi:stage V sporulation protein AC [Haloplasma contractile]|uniref:SpoVA family protein n=1 Tax=Haloplasma contractile SSD-17B TaxID=1033810 RepID=F7PVL5_9MOLU|nr:stage V sporulation protein AC [Haloplasma contractile]ERJ12819.1 SpoVA family protein [Haloplasma contractile SSD-17B]